MPHRLMLLHSQHQQPRLGSSRRALGRLPGLAAVTRVAVASQRPAAPSRRSVAPKALQIDRRAHLELAWQRQAEQEERLEQLCAASSSGADEVLEISDLAQLEAVCANSGGRVVCVFMYSRTCGVCKEAAQRFEVLRREVGTPSARVFSRVFVHARCVQACNLVAPTACLARYKGGALAAYPACS